MTEFLTNNVFPPRCEKHNESMVLYFYERPGSPMGNGWGCQSCAQDRATEQTRWPNAGDPGGAEL